MPQPVLLYTQSSPRIYRTTINTTTAVWMLLCLGIFLSLSVRDISALTISYRVVCDLSFCFPVCQCQSVRSPNYCKYRGVWLLWAIGTGKWHYVAGCAGIVIGKNIYIKTNGDGKMTFSCNSPLCGTPPPPSPPSLFFWPKLFFLYATYLPEKNGRWRYIKLRTWDLMICFTSKRTIAYIYPYIYIFFFSNAKSDREYKPSQGGVASSGFAASRSRLRCNNSVLRGSAVACTRGCVGGPDGRRSPVAG